MSADVTPEVGLLTYRGMVYPWQCDHMGHMNVMHYVGKFDEATWQLFGALGLIPAFLRANNRGMAAVEQNILYRRELMPGDLISVRSVVLEVRERAVRFAHEMRKDDTNEVAAVCTMTGVHLDTVARRACPFPQEARERAQMYLGEPFA